MLGWADRRQVPVLAVLASVLFGFAATVMELLFPDKVLPVLLNIVGSTCLLVWTLSLLSQLVLRRRADRAGVSLPFRMAAFPWLTGLALAILALIFALLLYGDQTRLQFLSMVVLTLFIAGCSATARRLRSHAG
jgi:AAT family amino acid transporter